VKEKRINYNLGAVVALTGAVLGIVVSFIIFLQWYEPLMATEMAAGRPDEALIVQYVIPLLNDIGMLAGVLWALAAYGFFSRRDWAWPVAVVANVLALQGSFFPMIPALSRELTPAYALVFIPNLVTYFVLLWFVRRADWRIIAFSLFSGIAMVLSFMNGVASTDKIIVDGAPLYVAVQRLNWVAAAGWAVFTIALILKPVEGVRVLGIGAGLLEGVMGIPLGLATSLPEGGFSMFFPAPLLSLGLMVLLLLPWGRRLFGQQPTSSGDRPAGVEASVSSEEAVGLT
jgi:hypothetical protein